MTGPPAERLSSLSPGAAGQTGEVYEVRWPDGRRFDSRRKVTQHQARLLVQEGICDEVSSPTGILRYLKMRRNPPLKKFASVLAQANFTTVATGNLQEHLPEQTKGTLEQLASQASPDHRKEHGHTSLPPGPASLNQIVRQQTATTEGS